MNVPKASKAGLCALERARRYVGTTETPAHSNRGPAIDQWNRDAGVPVGSPWCMSFARAMFKACSRALGGGASVGYFQEWAAQHHNLVARPFRGDLVCYQFTSDNWPDHVGIVDRVLALPRVGRPFLIRTVEGNTSPTNDANGGAVMIRYRWASRCAFARIY